ncbi:MAG: hypothetical protein WCR72_11640, partial [Bacteroidota bacterium]
MAYSAPFNVPAAKYDLIAGKPHLPSIPAPAAHPTETPVAEGEPEAGLPAAAVGAEQPAGVQTEVQPALAERPAKAEAGKP